LALSARLILAFVTAWCSVFQSRKPLSLFSFRVIVILLSCLSEAARVSAFLFFKVSANFLKQFLSVRWLCKLFDKALVGALLVGLWQCACKCVGIIIF